MDLSGHSVCNDKQEKKCLDVLLHNSLPSGKTGRFLEIHCFSRRINHGKISKMGRLLVQKQYTNRDLPVVILLARKSKCFLSESFCRQDHSSLAPCVSQRTGTNEWVAFLKMYPFVRPTPP